jgi:hypothetical protein
VLFKLVVAGDFFHFQAVSTLGAVHGCISDKCFSQVTKLEGNGKDIIIIIIIIILIFHFQHRPGSGLQE